MDSNPKRRRWVTGEEDESNPRFGAAPLAMGYGLSFYLTWAHAGLFGFFLWALARAVLQGEVFFSVLLSPVVVFFAWRVRHYVTKYRAGL